MTNWRRAASACITLCGVLPSLGCDWLEVFVPPDAGTFDAAAEDDADKPPKGCWRTDDAGTRCEIPLGQYAISYRYLWGTCGNQPDEFGVRFDADDEQDYYPCEDHEKYMTSESEMYLDRECNIFDATTGGLVRRTRVRGTIRTLNYAGEIASELRASILVGAGAPCEARYQLRGCKITSAQRAAGQTPASCLDWPRD